MELHPMYVMLWIDREISNDLRAVSQILINVPFVLAVATYQRVSQEMWPINAMIGIKTLTHCC